MEFYVKFWSQIILLYEIIATKNILSDSIEKLFLMI